VEERERRVGCFADFGELRDFGLGVEGRFLME
jgi:hypothetical protein